MATFTIELSDLELKSLEYVAVDANDWIQNAVHERCRLAFEEMVADHIRTTMEAGGSLSGTKEDMAMATTLKSAKVRNEEMHAQALASMEAMNAGTN